MYDNEDRIEKQLLVIERYREYQFLEYDEGRFCGTARRTAEDLQRFAGLDIVEARELVLEIMREWRDCRREKRAQGRGVPVNGQRTVVEWPLVAAAMLWGVAIIFFGCGGENGRLGLEVERADTLYASANEFLLALGEKQATQIKQQEKAMESYIEQLSSDKTAFELIASQPEVKPEVKWLCVDRAREIARVLGELKTYLLGDDPRQTSLY